MEVKIITPQSIISGKHYTRISKVVRIHRNKTQSIVSVSKNIAAHSRK